MNNTLATAVPTNLTNVDEDEGAEPRTADETLEVDSVEELSLDEYFQSFMERMRISEVQGIHETAKSKRQSPTIKAVEPSQPSLTPAQELTNLAALREVAVSSARQAISNSTAKLVAAAYSKLMVAFGTVALAMLLLAISAGTVSICYWAALVSLGVSSYFGIRFFGDVRVIDSI